MPEVKMDDARSRLPRATCDLPFPTLLCVLHSQGPQPRQVHFTLAELPCVWTMKEEPSGAPQQLMQRLIRSSIRVSHSTRR